MTNLAITLCIFGSTFGLQAETEEFGPRTTGRPMDGAVAARPVETQADVWLTFRPDPLLNFQLIALGPQTKREGETTTKPIYSPQIPIPHKDVPNDKYDFCFAVVNRRLVTQEIAKPSDLEQLSTTWKTQIGSFNGAANGELRYTARVFGATLKPKLRLYLWRAEPTSDGKFEWKLTKQKDAQF